MDRVHFANVGDGEVDAVETDVAVIEPSGWVTIYDRVPDGERMKHARRESFPPHAVASVVWNVD